MQIQGKQPEVLFWVGCAGSFDDRKKITSICTNLNRANVPLQYSVPKRVAQVIQQKEQEMSSCSKCKR
jgi:hypothetical protein